MVSHRIALPTVLVCAAFGLAAAGCGGSSQATSSPIGTDAQAAVSSVGEAATAAASSATASGASVAEDAKQRISSALPALDGMIDSVAVNDADGVRDGDDAAQPERRRGGCREVGVRFGKAGDGCDDDEPDNRRRWWRHDRHLLKPPRTESYDERLRRGRAW